MGRSPSCSHDGLKKGPWTAEEDQVLTEYIQNHGGHGSWRTLPKRAGLNRCGKSCRLRWTNYLRPDIKRGNFDQEEKQLIINLHSALGNKWSKIAAHLPGRTDNEIKNFWNTHLRRKLVNNGIDPKTHKPIHGPNFLVNLYQLILQSATSNLTNLMTPLNYGALELKPYLAQPAADIQVLQNLWQFIDSTSSYSLSQFDGLINGTSSAPYGMNSNNTYQESSTFLNMRDCRQKVNEDLAFPNSAASFGGQFSPEVFQNNMNSLLSNNEYCSAQRENLLPALEMPEISTVKETTSESINPACFPTDTSSNIFETLEKLVDDFENSTSFWNDTIITH